MKKNLPDQHAKYKYQTEDAYRLIITAGIVTIIMVTLIRLDVHTFISNKIKVSPDQLSQSNESDTTAEPISSPGPSEQFE